MILKDIAPVDAVNYSADSRLCHTEFRSDGRLTFPMSIKVDNFGDVGFCKRPIPFISSFIGTVLHVLGLCSWEKVRWTKAWGIVASVAGKDLFGQRSKSDLICCAVNNSSRCQLSISQKSSRPRPFHAGIIFGDMLKKFLQQLETGKLVAHLSALLWRLCPGLAAFARCGASSIITP